VTAGKIARRRRQRRNGGGGGQPRSGGGASSGGGSRRRWLLVTAGLATLLLVVALASAGGAAIYGVNRYDEIAEAVVPPEELLSQLPRGGARIYDRHGTLLYEFVDELSGLRRPVPLAEISPWLLQATIATEDQNFYENNGLNVRGLTRATLENFTPFGEDFLQGSGGSSITQQLAKNVYIPREERAERSVDRKLKETVIALELTRQYEKNQILEWYLNSISYGGIYVGIEAAAEGYFGKTAAELTLPEAALLAGIPQSPVRFDPINNLPLAELRQEEVLGLMAHAGAITLEQAEAAGEAELVFKTNRFDIEAPHFVLGRIAQEIEERFGSRALYEDGLEVVTTLDLTLQHEGERIIERWVSEFEVQSGGHNGALFALDPRTGQILVYVGSRDYFRDDIEGRNDNIIAQNSPGSTLKPFTYMAAFMNGWSTGTGIIDEPTKIIDPATGEFFEPRNPGGKFQGILPAREALGNSLNIPAFKAILFAGVSETVDLLKQVGFTTLDNPLGYGPALTLGGVDITLQDITYAYSVLANEGLMRGQEMLVTPKPGTRQLEPIALLRVTNHEGELLYQFTEPTARRVVPSNFAYLVTSIISDGDNQCITFGCGALGLPGRPSAQKTGTSEPFEDSEDIGDTWALGFTPELVAGMWAGNSDNSPMHDIFSTTISWRSWRDFMTLAHEQLELPPTKFERPTGVEERELCWPSGRLPSELCPRENRYSGLFAADVLPRDEDELAAMVDTWWQLVRIDTRTGLRATATTPSAFVSEEVRLVLPEEEIKDWEDLPEWSAANGLIGLLAPPEDSTAAGALVSVISPVAAQTVFGQLQIRGRADAPDFESFTVEWGRGSSPDVWVRLRVSDQPVSAGVLASWTTTSVPNGAYTVRVVVNDAKLGRLRFAVPVTVDNGDAGAPADLAPWGQITQPAAGAVVSGTVVVTGSAITGELIEASLDVGAGLSPSSWVEIGRIGQPQVATTLGRWETTELEDGTYTLRLTIRDRQLGLTEITTVLTVRNETDGD
jgi:membrane peptidoglycan carboxypeptidase